ncbi:MAG: hypothetical protein ACLRSA_02040 [Streptococcus salivarius]
MDGKHYYFDRQGKQVKGQFILITMANVTLTKTLRTLTNTIQTINGKTYSFDKNGSLYRDLSLRLRFGILDNLLAVSNY